MRIGVRGTGRIGLMHARNLAQTTGVDEVVLMGRNQARLAVSVEHVCAAIQLDAPSELAGNLAPRGRVATVTAGVGLAEELGALDGAVVGSSTSTHPAFALQIARAGVPSLVEKPLALDPGQLTALADQLDDIGTEVMVAVRRRYDPGHQLLRRRILAGDAGTVRAVTATEHDHLALPPEYVLASGGIWLDMLIHDFDTIPVGHWPTCPQRLADWLRPRCAGPRRLRRCRLGIGGVDPRVWSCRHGERSASGWGWPGRPARGLRLARLLRGWLRRLHADDLDRAGDQSTRPSLRPIHRAVRTRLPRRGRRVHSARLRDGCQPHPAVRRTRCHPNSPGCRRVDPRRLHHRPRLTYRKDPDE